jgi:hypothetical protein
VFTVFFKGVDGHDWKIGVVFGISGEIKVNHFFHDLIVHERGSAHLREDGGCVHTDGHVANDFFDDLPAFFGVISVDDSGQETKLRRRGTIWAHSFRPFCAIRNSCRLWLRRHWEWMRFWSFR